MSGFTGTLTPRQRELLITVATARVETLLRWSFYFRPGTRGEGNDWFGHPDLYGHDLPVDRRDVEELRSRGLLIRLTESAEGFFDEYDVSPAGILFYRRANRWRRMKRLAPTLVALLAIIAIIAVVFL